MTNPTTQFKHRNSMSFHFLCISVQVEAFIWDRDSHGLYDYESKHVIRQSMKVTGCNMISRKEQDLKALIPNVDNQEEYQNLASLVYKQGQYWMFHSKSLNDDSFKNHADRVWKIVKYENYQNRKMNSYRLQEGEVIKFGRVRFRIKKLCVDSSILNSNAEENVDYPSIPTKTNIVDNTSLNNHLRANLTTLENDNMFNSQGLTDPETRMTMNFNRGEHAGFDNKLFEFENEESKQSQQEMKLKNQMSLMRQKTGNMSEQLICRICLSEEEPTNLLISPCSCTGSMKYIHIECLKEWLEGKKHMRETPVVNSYIWKNLECEICKASYTDTTTLKSGQEVSLLKYNVHTDATSFMIIESVTNTTSKTIHVINFNQRKKIKVGRGQNAEVRITDISVSRFHSLIKMNKRGEVFIEDNQSKFGTLIQLGQPTTIKQNTPTYVQVGRSVLVLYTVNRFSCFERCFLSTSSRKKDNTIHFDEAYKYFPIEFTYLFDTVAPKHKKNSSNQVRSYRSQNQERNTFEVGSQRQTTRNELINQSRSSEVATSYMINNAQSRNTNMRNEDRQVSVAIEFVTHPERFDSENPYGIIDRNQMVSGLVTQMQSLNQRDGLAGQRIQSQNDILVHEVDMMSQRAVNFEQQSRIMSNPHLIGEPRELDEEELKLNENTHTMNYISQEQVLNINDNLKNEQEVVMTNFKRNPLIVNEQESSVDIKLQDQGDGEFNQIHQNNSIFNLSRNESNEVIKERNEDENVEIEEMKIKEYNEEDEQEFQRQFYYQQSLFNKYGSDAKMKQSTNLFNQGSSLMTSALQTEGNIGISNISLVNYEKVQGIRRPKEITNSMQGITESQKELNLNARAKTVAQSKDFNVGVMPKETNDRN